MPNFSCEATICAQYLTVIVYLQTPKALWLFVRELPLCHGFTLICLPLKGCWVSFALCSSNSALKRMMYPSMSFLYPIVLLILCILTEHGFLWDQTLRVRNNSAIFKEDTTSCQVCANPILGAEKMSGHNSFLESMSSL